MKSNITGKAKKSPIILLVILLFLIGPFLVIQNQSSQFDEDVIKQRMKKSQPGPDQRPSEWLWMQRTYPYFNYDLKSYHQNLQNAQEMRKNAKNTLIHQVEYAGPSNIGGRITDIEFNPLDPNVVYAGAASGGVFKSVDMGTTWFPVFDDQA
ncbi:MAG: hypothetical protein KAR38_05195, partial [Calditrichia bacterium]|nr:hypothetical protein [Calditrichia bacterium]